MARASAGVSCWAIAGAATMTRTPKVNAAIARRTLRSRVSAVAPVPAIGMAIGFALLDMLEQFLPENRNMCYALIRNERLGPDRDDSGGGERRSAFACEPRLQLLVVFPASLAR